MLWHWGYNIWCNGKVVVKLQRVPCCGVFLGGVDHWSARERDRRMQGNTGSDAAGGRSNRQPRVCKSHTLFAGVGLAWQNFTGFLPLFWAGFLLARQSTFDWWSNCLYVGVLKWWTVKQVCYVGIRWPLLTLSAGIMSEMGIHLSQAGADCGLALPLPGCIKSVWTVACPLEMPFAVSRIGLCAECTLRPCVNNDVSCVCIFFVWLLLRFV